MKISELMLKEHQRIYKLINEIIKSPKEELKKNIDKLKWNLEKHMFVEEKVIFSFYEIIKGEEINEIFEIMQTHGKIIDLIKEIEKNFEIKKLETLKEILEDHVFFEDKKFYPKIDSELTKEQKQQILDRIGEIRLE